MVAIAEQLELWPHQAFAISETIRLIQAGERRICLTSPTGGGKTRCLCELVLWAVNLGLKVVVYTNRRLLREQLSAVVHASGIDHGIRASGHAYNPDQQVQISMMQTETQRVGKPIRDGVYKGVVWALHDAQLVIIDEAHLMKESTAQRVIDEHVAAGAFVLGVTATPLNIGHIYTKLIVAGKTSDLRKCGALLPCCTYGPDEPDTKHIKRQASGDFSENDIRKVIMTSTIFGRVFDCWKQLNPDARPTILFAPGVPESRWFGEQFFSKGISAAHIDGSECWVNGRLYKKDQKARQDILAGVRSGDIPIICNRFVLREGIDLPELYHAILATVFGSLQSFLQSGGRLLRSFPGMDRVILQDHGGNWWRHGSLNADREWRLEYTANIVNGMREEAIREKRIKEPIRCPQCGAIRTGGPECPVCHFKCGHRTRPVVQKDGSLQEMHGDIFKPRRVANKPDTYQKWEQMYHRARRSKNGMTFRQAEALFFVENFYYPPRDLPFMPVNDLDWYRRVKDVGNDRLTGRD